MTDDDWNEAFWSAQSLRRLMTLYGTPLMLAKQEDRWELLLQADWVAFFQNSPKTFRELRWWYCLLASKYSSCAAFEPQMCRIHAEQAEWSA